MEKTKDIPGWYQRLLNAESNPASQITFKQYCQENETRMKILCPFLPLDQIKGRLYSQWKRKQPPGQKTLRKSGAKAQKKMLYPVVQFFQHKKANSAIQSTKKSLSQLDWLKEASSKPAEKDGRTYNGRTFVLSPKVPEVISQSSTIERSILKGGRAGAESSREKRQLTSRVSFNSEIGDLSPSLYSPPTPFVLSPVSQGDPMEEEITSPSQTKFLMKSHLKVVCKNTNHFKKPTNWAPKQRRMMERGKPGSTIPHGYSSRNKEENSALKIHPQKSTPKRREKAADNTEKTIRKFPRGMPEFAEADPDFVLPLSQYFESPKFGTPAHETPDRNKRFCLFEDELIFTSKPPKETSKNPKKKSLQSRSKHKKYSWSPASSAHSQQTPKLKKSKHSFCSQEKPETYYKEKRHKTGAFGRNKNESFENTKDKSHILKDSAGKRTGSMKRNSPRKSEIVKKINENQRSAHSLHPLPTDVSVEDIMEDQAICNKKLSKSFTKEVKTTQIKTDPKGSVQKGSRHRNCRVSPSMPTTAAKESQKSKSFPQNEGSCFSETNNKSLRSTKDNQNMNKSVNKTKKDKMRTDGNTNRDQQKEQRQNFPCSDRETRRENKSPKFSPLLHSVHEMDSNALAIDEENNHSPETSASSINVLWNILSQLKSTAASSQSQTNLQSSPAQSRLTENSEMSMKSPSSCAPSPAIQNDLMDYFGPTVAEEFPVKDMVPVINTASRYRKRGNILCNMFDAADSTDNAVPAKMKRNILSTTEGDFSMLFNDQMII